MGVLLHISLLTASFAVGRFIGPKLPLEALRVPQDFDKQLE